MSEPVDMRHVEILGYGRYQERLRAAKMWSDRHARPHRSRPGSYLCRSMAWMGRRLTAWGWRLQERFDGARPVSAA